MTDIVASPLQGNLDGVCHLHYFYLILILTLWGHYNYSSLRMGKLKLDKELPNSTRLSGEAATQSENFCSVLSAAFAQLEVLWPGHAWLCPAKISVCAEPLLPLRGPGLCGPLLSSKNGQDADLIPHCFWKPLAAQSALSSLSLLCHIRLPAFQGSSIIPRVLLQGQRLAEVFTCLKMYQAINRSYFPSLLRSWVCSFLSFSSPFVSFNKEEKE